MSDSTDPRAGGALTNGFLPAAAFAHDEPTAVGVIDLDGPLAFLAPPGVDSLSRCRDALALVRLHGHCLAMIHVDRPVEQIQQAELAERVWAATAANIRAHIEKFGCCDTAPSNSDALRPGLGPAQACRPAHPESRQVSVVVPTIGRPDTLRRCLLSLRAAPRCVGEVIVVDNRPDQGGTNDIVQSIADGDGRFRYVPEPRAGHAVARNRGACEARGEIVAFVDDDVVADPAWPEWIAAPFADPDVGAVTGMVLPISLATSAQKRFERYAGYSKGTVRRVYDLAEHRADDRFMYPFWGALFGTGANMAFRRASLLRLGGFDPALPGGEDTEALSVIVRSGARLVYEPSAVCWHSHHSSEEDMEHQVFGYGTSVAANITKAMLTDPRCLPAIVRAVPIAIAHRRRHAGGGADSWTEPRDLIRAQRRGMLFGPLRYVQGRRRVRRLGLGLESVTDDRLIS